MRAAIYCRVSSKSQDDALQLHDLEALCLRSGWTVVSVFRDKISGLTASNDRAALRELLVCARQRKFDKVVVWSVDRLGRSMPQLISTLTELNACGIQLVSFRQGIDTSTPMGSMLWQFLGIFAEFEHSIRKERQTAGIARAKERGVKFGRPTISFIKRRDILTLRSQGMGINKIAAQLRVGSGTVSKTIRDQSAGLR
jgi:DNA invertase Pin-like site-specific DNA recombinase